MQSLNFIVLTGRFAAGKDTQAELLIKKLGDSSEIISTGDIYRSAKEGRGKYAHFHYLVASYIEDIDVRGKLLPDNIMTKIVQEVISEEVQKNKETFVFTGFPRTTGQLDYFNRMISDFGQKYLVNSIFIEYKISDETTLERSRARRQADEHSGLESRPWDTDEGVAKRTSTYYKDIEPMIERLKSEGKLITIEAGRSIPQIETETSFYLSKERM